MAGFDVMSMLSQMLQSNPQLLQQLMQARTQQAGLNPWSTGYPNLNVPQAMPMQNQMGGRSQLPQMPQQRGMYGMQNTMPTTVGTPGMAMQNRAPMGMMGGQSNVAVPGRNVGASFGGPTVGASMGNPRMVGQTVNSRGPFLGGMLQEFPYK